MLRKELEDRLARKNWKLEWADVIRDVDNLTEMENRHRRQGLPVSERRPREPPARSSRLAASRSRPPYGSAKLPPTRRSPSRREIRVTRCF